ncbi:hypothetical protein CR513_60512, partial [Mucuna pruriens]
MTVRTKIDVYAETLSMMFGDNLVQFNIFEAMKHLTEDPTFFGIDIIDELVEEHMQLDTDNVEFLKFSGDTDYEELECLKHVEVQVAKTKKSLSAQVVTIFFAEYDSANKGQDLMKAESDLVKEIKAESDLSIQLRAESNSDSEGRKQAKAISISDNRV